MNLSLSISDDDLCADCMNLHYNPGGRSRCEFDFEAATINDDGYVTDCTEYDMVGYQGENWDLSEEGVQC